MFLDEQEYEEYLRKNQIEANIEYEDKSANYFEWTKDGKIILPKSTYQKSNIDVERYTTCITWVLLKDKKTMMLIKHPFGDIYRNFNPTQYYTALYNNIILPQIAIQFANSSAKYYLAIDKQKRTKVVTPDFKQENEELIHGEEILEAVGKDINELSVEKLLEAIEEYLIDADINSERIKRIKRNFIKQSLFNKFIKQTDENNHNWGILMNSKENTARLAPLYDMECSCDCGTRTKHLRKAGEEKTTTLDGFIKQFANEEWFQEYLGEVIDQIDINEALEKAKKETKTEIPKKYQEKYRDFFAERLIELKGAYEKYVLKKEKDYNFEQYR